MSQAISHDRNDETIEAKTRWFKSISVSARMEMFCSFVDLVLTLNPELSDKKDAQQIKGRIQTISAQ